MEVYTKYLDPDPANWQGAFAGFLGAYTSSPAAGNLVDHGVAGSIGSSAFPYASLLQRTNANGQVPKVFLTWLVFDKDFNPVFGKCGFVQVSALAREDGTNVSHERLAKATPLEINEPGYVYIYISNENDTPIEAFFDDFKVEVMQSPIVQTNDYYPFGLTYNSYSRDNSKQDYLYNSKELQDGLSFYTYDYGARQYDPAIGRFLSVDPASESMRRVSPFAYSFNNPVRYTDPDGMFPSDMVDWDWPCIGCAGPAGGRREWDEPRSLWDDFNDDEKFFKDWDKWSTDDTGMPQVASLGQFADSDKDKDKKSDNKGSGSDGDSGGKKKGGTKVGNALRILGSLFAVSKDKTFAGKVVQILSHLTWELPQQLAGILTAEVTNAIGGIKNAYFKDGALVLESKFMRAETGFTMGNIITVGENSSAKTISHEYGHYIQSRIFGPGYLPGFAIPSFFRATGLTIGWSLGWFQNVVYDKFYTESYATKLGNKFFGK
jgi:RHS repeat-associated protein